MDKTRIKGFLLLLVLASLSPLASAQQLIGQDCGFRQKCFFNDKGDLLYWVTEYHQVDERSRAVKNVYVTAYAAIKNKQQEFNDWLDHNLPGEEKHHVDPTGRLNLATLRIPSQKGFARAIVLWRRFQMDCRRAVIKGMVKEMLGQEASAASCETALVDYKGPLNPGQESKGITFPDETLQTRADSIREAFTAAIAHYRLVGELEPLTAEWNNLNDPAWQRLGETGHIEITQLPASFLGALERAEIRVESKIVNAEDFEEIYKRDSQ